MKLYALILILISIAAHAKEGSGGTTGGGDDTIQGIDLLLPDSLEFEYTSKIEHFIQGDIVVGTRKCWGFKTCNSYAREISVVTNFSKNAFIQKPSEEQFWREARYKNASRKLENGEVKYLPSSPNYESTELKRIVYNGKSWSMAELRTEFRRIESIVWGQLDFLNFETVKAVKELDQFYKALGLDNSPKDLFDYRLLVKVADEAKEITSLAYSAIDPKGNCDRKVYKQAKSRLSKWTLGSNVYFEWLKQKVGLVYSEKYIRYSVDSRQKVFFDFANSVGPICEPRKSWQNTRSEIELLLEK